MGQFDEMLERADLQSIGQFIQYEGVLNVKKENNLEEQEKQARMTLKNGLLKKVQKEALDEVLECALQYAETYAAIHFTVGMQAGAKIVFQLLNDSIKENK